MPRGDRTGPMGMGPMTGRAAGFCAGYDAPGYASSAGGRAWGGRGGAGGRGGGRGWRNMYYATGLPGWARTGAGFPSAPAWTAEQERAALQAQARAMEEALQGVRERLRELGQEAE